MKIKFTYRKTKQDDHGEPQALAAQLANALPQTIQKKLPIYGTLLSGLLLALSFPGYGYDLIAYIALVPWMFALINTSFRKAAFLGWLNGFVFFLISLSWLQQTTNTVDGFMMKASCIFAYILLSMLCALYFIPAALAVSACIRRWGTLSLGKNILTMVVATSFWTGAEYIRSFLFTGFPWNQIGISQYQNLATIQIADKGGVYAVTACIVWLNTAIFVTFMQYTHGFRAQKYRPHLELMVGVLPLALSIAYGIQLLMNPLPLIEKVDVALIQPNIAQSTKWDEEQTKTIYNRLENLTYKALQEGPDLVVWPETAVPDYLRYSEKSYNLVRKLAAVGSPVLVGTMDVELSGSNDTKAYYNSSMLIETNGIAMTTYNKQHLVPFGEYIPLPMIRKYTPLTAGDLTPGKEVTIFKLPQIQPFSVLICFEDIIAPLAAQAVRSGAQWLINQTNDGWFDPSSQSEQHLAHAVFRCIENRIPMVRCCNTGVSCSIDLYGQVKRGLAARKSGHILATINPRTSDMHQTSYTRYGDRFAQGTLISSLLFLLVYIFSKKKTP